MELLILTNLLISNVAILFILWKASGKTETPKETPKEEPKVAQEEMTIEEIDRQRIELDRQEEQLIGWQNVMNYGGMPRKGCDTE